MNAALPLEPEPGREPFSLVPYRFCLLGELSVSLAGEDLAPPPHRTLSLLAALLLDARPQRRERLAGLLFPAASARKGRQRLSHLLWLLRQSLPDLPVETSPDEVYLPATSRWLDVEAFGLAAGSASLEGWLEALLLYRGDLLEDVYDDWLLERREVVYLQYVRLAHRALEELLQQMRFEDALPLAESLVRREPFDEHALRCLIHTYRSLGRRGAALAAYDSFVSMASEELGAGPEPATRALAQAIRHEGRPAATRPSAEAGAPAGDAPCFSGDESPEALLRQARLALSRGEKAVVEEALRCLRAQGAGHETEVCLLEIDLALMYEDLDNAEGLLESCDFALATERARAAQLALARHDPIVAQYVANEALVLAHEAQDRQAELAALLALVQAQYQLGEHALAIRGAERALHLATSLSSPEGQAQALRLKGQGQLNQGRYDRALTHLHEARSLALEHGLRCQLALTLGGIRLVQSYTNCFSDALDTAQEELSLWRDLGIVRWEAVALEGLALIQDLLGYSADSLRTLEQALEISRQLGEPVRLATTQYNIACSMLYLDDSMAPRAIDEAQLAVDCFQTYGQSGWQSAALTILGYAQWVDGRHAAALDTLRLAYRVCEEAEELARLPELLAYQGLACLGQQRADEALALTRDAVLSLTQGKVSEEVVPEIYYAHAMALAANGLEDQAAGYLARAYDRLLTSAAQLADEEARQAFFHHNPTLRRLMNELYRRGLAHPPAAGVVFRSLPAARGGPPVRVRWTVDAGPVDATLEKAAGRVALRQARLSRLLQEAGQQGASPTIVDLANALQVSERTIQRDLALLRDAT